MDNPLIHFLKQSYEKENPFRKRLLHYLTYELNQKIYYYGEHFIAPREKKYSWLESLKIHFLDVLAYCYYMLFSFRKKKDNRKVIISSAYHRIEKLQDFNNYLVVRCPWVLEKKPCITDLQLFRLVQSIKNDFRTASFRYLLSPAFEKKAKKYMTLFTNYVERNRVCAMFIPQEIGFFEKIAIDVLRDKKIPSFEIIHGYPGYYQKATYNATDYLCVWGLGIKENFVAEGIPVEKIIVTGHPIFTQNFKGKLKNSLENILVLAKSPNGAQFDENYTLQDRGKSIFYLESVKKVLISLGVRKVRLRLHPSENPAWYKEFLDLSFFEIDNLSLAQSLKNTSLVISCTSTVFFEALETGVNAIVYEPKDESGDFIEPLKLVPPFDGSDEKVPVAHDEKALYELLFSKPSVDLNLLDKYIDNSATFSKLVAYIEQKKE